MNQNELVQLISFWWILIRKCYHVRLNATFSHHKYAYIRVICQIDSLLIWAPRLSVHDLNVQFHFLFSKCCDCKGPWLCSCKAKLWLSQPCTEAWLRPWLLGQFRTGNMALVRICSRFCAFEYSLFYLIVAPWVGDTFLSILMLMNWGCLTRSFLSKT